MIIITALENEVHVIDVVGIRQSAQVLAARAIDSRGERSYKAGLLVGIRLEVD